MDPTGIDTQHYYYVLDQHNQRLAGADCAFSSSDEAVAQVLANGDELTLVVNPVGAGSATISVTRNSDLLTATVDVDVTVVAGEFAIHLGDPIAKP